MSEPELARREQLLADAALGWLSPEDEVAFAAMLREPHWEREFGDWEHAAALPMLALATADSADSIGDRQPLLARLDAAALGFFAANSRSRQDLAPHDQATALAMHSTPIRALPSRLRRALPWLVAAMCAVTAMRPPWRNGDERLTAGREPPAAEQRDALLHSGAAVLTCAWTPGPSAQRGEVNGDVVWHASRQEGYLRLRGLPELDRDHRYQLWIVDSQRQGPPVDGGLLAPAGQHGEFVVHVTPRLPVHQAAAFVLTIEPAAGVVVSAQEHVVAIARL